MNKRDFIAGIYQKHAGPGFTEKQYDGVQQFAEEAYVAWLVRNPTQLQKQVVDSVLEKKVLDILNETSGSKFRNGQDLKARISEGYQLEDFRLMLVHQWNKWRGTDFEKYFQPSTLFRKSKFEGYLNDAIRATNGAYSRADKVRELLGQ